MFIISNNNLTRGAVLKKTFVLDTNVLLHNPRSLVSFEDNIVLLPIEVLEELDRFKRNHDEKNLITLCTSCLKAGKVTKNVRTKKDKPAAA